jgi:hypothetical protein
MNIKWTYVLILKRFELQRERELSGVAMTLQILTATRLRAFHSGKTQTSVTPIYVSPTHTCHPPSGSARKCEQRYLDSSSLAR